VRSQARNALVFATLVLAGGVDAQVNPGDISNMAARAQMAYYMLNRGGVEEKRFERIEGFADHRLKDPGRPFGAENRRIEILLREAAQ
jgi:hypothetical protein